MKSLTITIPYEELTYAELDRREAELVRLAREATERSYAPYSHFRVGAAIALSNGEPVVGSNHAHARYPEAKFEAIAIAARGLDGEFTCEPTAPCGACRQALLEYEMLAGHPVELLLAGRDKIYRLPSIVSTLPFAFTELTES